MVTPILFFAATGIASGWIILKYNIAFTRVEKNLEQAFRKEGLEWKFATDFTFRRALFRDPSSILLSTDSTNLAAAKIKMINQRMLLAGTIKRAIITALVGLFITIIVSLCELRIRGV
jgi:hypothetical protein